MREVEFRDGVRLVPAYVADILAAYETYQMTYEEAMKKMNRGFLEERLVNVQSDAIAKHLARYGR